MITLLTGLPGNGKTLFALWYIRAKSVKENREVFYHNVNIIDNVALPWTEFDPEKWMDLPFGSMIVIDEAQDVFAKKPNGAKLPDFYSELAKHRHKGFDIFLITQHPTLIDNFPRQLVGQHFHSVRKFGMSRATVYEWSSANPSPQSASSQKSAITLKFAYPKEVYSWYKSAEVHTVKRAIPAKLILAVFFIVAVIAGGYYGLDSYQKRGKVIATGGVGAVPVGGVGGGTGASGFVGAGSGLKVPVDPIADAKGYVFANTARVAGLPHTAPKYDELTKPSRVPVPAACIQRGSVRGGRQITCKCFSQQGTPMPVEFNMCVDFAQNGFFQEFDADRDRIVQQAPQLGVQVSERHGDAVASSDRVGPSVVVIPNEPYVSQLKGAPVKQ